MNELLSYSLKQYKKEKERKKERIEVALSNFSNESALRGIQPEMASPATAVSQEGQPARTCAPLSPLVTLNILETLGWSDFAFLSSSEEMGVEAAWVMRRAVAVSLSECFGLESVCICVCVRWR